MVRRARAGQRVSSLAGAALMLIGTVIAFGHLERAVEQLAGPIIGAASVGLAALPSMTVAVWHALAPCALIHQAFVEGFFRVLVSSWPAILAIVGA